jgi:hypothetical protein
MAEADPTELAAFLRTVKGQFQESPGRLAAKLAHICETLRNSGQEDQPTYRLVARYVVADTVSSSGDSLKMRGSLSWTLKLTLLDTSPSRVLSRSKDSQ